MNDIYLVRIEMGPAPSDFFETRISNSLYINCYGNLMARFSSNSIEYFPNGNVKKVGWCDFDYYSNSGRVLSILNTEDGHLRFDYVSIYLDKITSNRGMHMELYYTPDKRIEKITGTSKGTIYFRYDYSGRLTSIESSALGTLKTFR